jgi:hypothetical protein
MMIYCSVPRKKPKRKPKNVIAKPKVTKQLDFRPMSSYNLTVPNDRLSPHYPSATETTLGALPKSGIMRDYHKMSDSDRKIVDKVGQCLAPLHKGNYVYVSEGLNPASLGRKNEVL